MDENTTMTPEQSLRLINETLDANCKNIAKRSGSSFILWGALLAVTAMLVYLFWSRTGSPAWNFLWFAMPVAGFTAGTLLKKKEEKTPDTFVSKTIGYLWIAFCVFSVAFGLDACFLTPINISLVIILLFGFCLTSTGILLRNWPIILAGAISGTAGAINAVALVPYPSQMLIFAAAGVILVLTGLYIRYIKK